MNHNQEVIREEDEALLGYVHSAGDDQWTPRTIFGYPLAPAGSYDDALAEVERRGLESLAERWWFLDDTDNEWYTCTIQEATPGRVRVRIADFGHPKVYSQITIDNPSDEKLRL